jgi:hypothetical protein
MRITRTQDRIPLPQKASEKVAHDAASGCRPEFPHEAERDKNSKDGHRDDG